ncbi:MULTISPECIES: 5-oxoprolinase subunit PxpB [Paraliobacillus]|uniref:5-oxoprolinase subunit PxpB n=1 Tax=Paraliobacillus TaxID=200903 RepID=UPI000DD40EE2|nr:MULTISPECIES: 5-oxoprolinase subunit PxpB [Paraliobacillus]
MNISFTPLGDQTIVIEFGQHIDEEIHVRVMAAMDYLERNSFNWLVEYIPTFTTLTVLYDPVKVMKHYGINDRSKIPYQFVQQEIEQAITSVTSENKGIQREIEIPVCYGGTFGPDLGFVAKHHCINEQDVIDIHTKGNYLVYMIGFAPGFPYIGGMSSEIATPRKKSPRFNLPAGTVGIAGQQTGIYPLETPGGWQLIGKTPLALFQPKNSKPSLLRAGDKVRFKAINKDEYDRLEGRL